MKILPAFSILRILLPIKPLLLPAIFVLLTSISAFSQKSNIKFQRLTINDGLSLSSVYCIYEDQKGFMWFGTEDGLNKYDGENFTIYRPDITRSNSLSYRWIEQIFEDSHGVLWFGSKGGLTSFNPETEIFGQYRHLEGDPSSLDNDTITAICEDGNGFLWIGTTSGLNRIEIQTGQLQGVTLSGIIQQQNISQVYELNCDDKGNLWVCSKAGLFKVENSGLESEQIHFGETEGISQVFSIKIRSNTLWVGTQRGLVKYDQTTGESVFFGIDACEGNPEQSQKVEKIIVDHDDKLWVGTPEGLFLFDEDKGSFSCLVEAFDSNQSLSVNTTKPLCLDMYGTLWYGTYGSGIYKISPSPLQIVNYRHNAADANSLSQNAINCIYEDRTGVIWIGTFGAGICVFDPHAHKFELITHDPTDDNSLSNDFVWTVFEADGGAIWIGTNQNGLNRYSPITGLFTHFINDESDPHSIPAASIRKVYQDSEGTIWVGTDGGGLAHYNPETENFTHFTSDPNDPNTLSSNSVRVISEDYSGNFWVGTRNGLNKLDRKTGKFKRYLNIPDDPNSISQNFIYSSIFQDSKGNLWMGTYGGGLNKMNIEEETFKAYRFDPDKPYSLSDDIVFSIFEDKDGILWLGTNNGLNRFDSEKETFLRFGIDQGLPNEVIYGILPDDQNNIWLSTNLGISKLNLGNYTVENFDVNDGLQSNEFNGGAFHKGKSGKLYFGGVYGLNIIKPEKMSPNKNQSLVVLTGIDVLGKEVKTGDMSVFDSSEKLDFKLLEHGDQLYLSRAVSYTPKLILDYKHRFLGFDFTTLNIPPSEKVSYRYKMENMDEEWNFSGKRNYVTYANMSPGTYIFKVNAMNEAGEVSPNPAELLIVINPPFWGTWWFYLIEILAALLLASFIYVYLLKTRTNKLLTHQNQQIQAANLKLTESEKKLKELNITKDKFFSIIAHDLKNPFTSLLSISELLSKNYESLDDEDKRSGIDGFYRSSRRIYSLLENLLMWSRTQTGRVKFCPQEFDIAELTEECYDLLALSAEKKEIDFHIWTMEGQKVFADREMIHTVLRNLLHNAMKYSETGGKVTLQVKKMENSLLKIAVIDEGVGICEDRLNKLFKLSTTTNSNGTAGEKGTGLGLIVCKEFVERNGSKLLVKSEVGQGSEFSFYLQRQT